MDDLGNLLQCSSVNWWEVALRIVMTALNSGLALLFFALTSLYVFRDSSPWREICALLALGLLIGSWFPIVLLVKVLWQMPRLEVYEQGIRWNTRQQENIWMWDQLDRFQVRTAFGVVLMYTYVYRKGLFVVYAGASPVLEITPMLYRAAKVSQLIAAQIEQRHQS
jgi:hypothetical protein